MTVFHGLLDLEGAGNDELDLVIDGVDYNDPQRYFLCFCVSSVDCYCAGCAVQIC